MPIRPTSSPLHDDSWPANAVIYQIDPVMFLDTDGDGWGDLPGITAKLEYICDLGADTVWLLPFYESPFDDGGYDVRDHCQVKDRIGTLDDFDELIARAHELGLHVITELVAQHTSVEHQWFREAREDPSSPYRGFYVWSDEPVDTDVELILPGQEDSVWEWDEAAQQYYRHVFYAHEPDLEIGNPAVRTELLRIVDFWLDRGVDGFRLDAAPYMVERARAADERDGGFWFLDDLRQHVADRRPGAILMGEVDVEPELHADYFGGGRRLQVLLDFWVNNHVFLALARAKAEPIVRALGRRPLPPEGAHYAGWLRNHDELDLEQLTEAERRETMDAFAPRERERIYGRGIRRRLAPMLDDPRRYTMAYALLLSLPAVPIIRYGDEIGMGDNLERFERTAVRTPMQWSDTANAGFSSAAPSQLATAVISDGPFAYQKVNVAEQQARTDSLWAQISRLVHRRRRLGRLTALGCHPVDVGCESVLALRHLTADGHVTMLANLCDQPVDVNVGGADAAPGRLEAYEYRWLGP